jgi:integrase
LRLVAEYAGLAGFAPVDGPGRLTARDLRRTCARNAFDNGASLRLVQAMSGHNDPKTAVRYIGACEREGDSAVDYVRY